MQIPTKKSGVPTNGAASASSPGRVRRCTISLSAAGRRTTKSRQPIRFSIRKRLTIGFARRFATYNRGNLLLRDANRLRALLEDTKRPIQFVFAGKAHPADHEGKELIKSIVNFARDPAIRRRMVFIENYDMNVARYLVQGVDVWLNTPRRPYEASGTSGMKAAANGVLNCSILDGWWVEGYEPDVGWAIGRGEDYSDPNYQDQVESMALYDLLEKQIVPLFYQRSFDNVPREWIARMKNCMRKLAPVLQHPTAWFETTPSGSTSRQWSAAPRSPRTA